MNGDFHEPGDRNMPAAALRRFKAGTVLIPAAAVFLHFVTVTLISIIYTVNYAFINGMLTGANPFSILLNPEAMNRLINEQFPIMSVIYCAGLIPVYLVYLLLQRKRDQRILMTEKPRVSVTVMAVIIMIGAIGVTNFWMTFLYSAGEQIPAIKDALNNYEQLAGAFSNKVGYFWLILGVCIMAPVTEELLFRGIVQGELRKAMPDWAAIIIQALLFALYHMQVIQISYVIIPGLLLGLLYYWTRSIWVPIIMHITFNILGTILPVMIGSDPAANTIAGIILLVFIVAGIGLVVYLFARQRRSVIV